MQIDDEIATFQQNVFLAQNSLTAAENALKAIMLADRNDLMWGMALVPDQAPEPRAELPALDAAMKEALTARPEMKQQSISIDINQLDAKLTNEQTKPQIDAYYATLGIAGLAGHVIPPSGANLLSAKPSRPSSTRSTPFQPRRNPPLAPISFGPPPYRPSWWAVTGNLINALGTGQFSTAIVGVNITLPVRNRTALANEAVSIAEGRRLNAQKQ